ncbi:Rha family transcriptional regulator [Glaciimonas sp. GNP009]
MMAARIAKLPKVTNAPNLNACSDFVSKRVHSAIVHLSKGKPVTDSRAISREFGRPHKNVLQSLDGLIKEGIISRLEFKPREWTDERGKKQRMIELTERGALIAMPFIGGKNSRIGQVRLVNAFLTMRDELANQSGDWSQARHKVSTGYQMMSMALQETREDDGKQTSAFHYANEAKLVNWVMFGRFECVDRNQMEKMDLDCMEKVEARNAIWIARGRTYPERKAALPAYLDSLRANRVRISS